MSRALQLVATAAVALSRHSQKEQTTTDTPQPTEAMIEAGLDAACLMHAVTAKPEAYRTEVSAIYLAMTAARQPDDDVVERVVEQLVKEGRSGRHMYNAEQNSALDDEARAFYRKVINRYRAAMPASPPGEALVSGEGTTACPICQKATPHNHSEEKR